MIIIIKLRIGFLVSILIWRSSISKDKRWIYTNAFSISRLYISLTLPRHTVCFSLSRVLHDTYCTHLRIMSLHVCSCVVCSRVPKSYVEVCSSSLQHKNPLSIVQLFKKNKDRERNTSKIIERPWNHDTSLSITRALWYIF